MSGRVDWTEDEYRRLFDACEKLWVTNKDKSLIALVTMAQVVLPENRHRKLVSVSNVPAVLRERLMNAKIGIVSTRFVAAPKEKSKDELRIEQLAAERDAALEASNNFAVALRAADQKIVELEVKLAAQQTPLQIIQTFCANVLREAGISLPIKAIEQAILPAKKHAPEMLGDDAGNKKNKVLVIGPKGHQITELEQEFGEFLELRIFNTDEARGRVNQMADGVQSVIFWTKFMSHDVDHSLSAPNKAKLFRAATFKDLKDKLLELSVK